MSKYGLAREVIGDLVTRASDMSIEAMDAQEALLVSLVQSLKGERGTEYVRSILQYEIDSLGSGGVHEIARGGGHS